ncbi:MAG TPA: hypothetical protein VJM49_04190 [Acidimicrobiales bacterium]|nr:hypothetical protein [Acidimicrobiales bacterium]
MPAASGEAGRGTAWWWRRITGAVLAAGALATAITAIQALLPSDPADTEDTAQFTGVRVTADVPLGEYQRRNAEMTPVETDDDAGAAGDDAAGVATVLAPPVDALVRRLPAPYPRTRAVEVKVSAPPHPAGTSGPPPTATAPDATEPTSPSSDDPTSDDTTSTSTGHGTTVVPSPGPSTEALPRFDVVTEGDEGTGIVLPPFAHERELQGVDRVEATASELARVTGCEDDPDGCTPYVVKVLPFIVAESVDQQGEPVPPDVAAQRVVDLLRDTRVGGDGDEPLGVVIATDIELEGLRGETVLLTWSMWQQAGGARLHGDWLDERLAYSLEATTEHDTTSLDLWIPLPPEPGPYFVRVGLDLGGSSLASADSEPFP